VNLYLFTICDRSYGFTTVALLAGSEEEARQMVLTKVYGKWQFPPKPERIELEGVAPAELGAVVTTEFQE
jgi:hypothetical protein